MFTEMKPMKNAFYEYNNETSATTIRWERKSYTDSGIVKYKEEKA